MGNDVKGLQPSVGIELKIEEENQIENDIDDTDGPAPGIFFDGEPYGDDTGDEAENFYPIHEAAKVENIGTKARGKFLEGGFIGIETNDLWCKNLTFIKNVYESFKKRGHIDKSHRLIYFGSRIFAHAK